MPSKETLFLLACVLLALGVAWRSTRLKVTRWLAPTGPIVLRIVQHTVRLTSLDATGAPGEVQVVRVPDLRFTPGRELVHATVGPLGYSEDFVVSAETDVVTSQRTEITWTVQSDDGFRLRLDGAVVGEHPGDRPYTATTLRSTIEPGRHRLQLDYYQGYGPLGLDVAYSATGIAEAYPVGQPSAGIRFVAPGGP